MERSYPQFTVTEKAERSIRAGHPWVYDTELLAGEAPDGALADVMSARAAGSAQPFTTAAQKFACV